MQIREFWPLSAFKRFPEPVNQSLDNLLTDAQVPHPPPAARGAEERNRPAMRPADAAAYLREKGLTKGPLRNVAHSQ